MSRHCPSCTEITDTPILPYINQEFESSGLFLDLRVVYCGSCGFGYCAPDIDDELLNHFYSDVYREDGSPHVTNFQTLRKRRTHDLRSLTQLILAHQFVEFNDGDVFLDIGPGWGNSFFSAQEVLTTPRMYAIEFKNAAAKAYERLYNVETFTGINALTDLGIRPKLILASHSLEHLSLHGLTSLLSELAELICPNGVLVAEVPLVDLRVAAESRGNDAPHLLFFTMESMRQLLENAGFEILFLQSCSRRREILHTIDDSVKKTAPVSLHLGIPGYIRSIMRQVLPPSVKKIVYSVLEFNPSERFSQIDFSDSNFHYGGDRECLRVVARPLSSATYRIGSGS